jgi:hypothetical protein
MQVVVRVVRVPRRMADDDSSTSGGGRPIRGAVTAT